MCLFVIPNVANKKASNEEKTSALIKTVLDNINDSDTNESIPLTITSQQEKY